jgi:hypothetical protein
MIQRPLALLALLLLAGVSLQGCIAVAIPAIAGSALAGSRVASNSDKDSEPPETVSETTGQTAPDASTAPSTAIPAPQEIFPQPSTLPDPASPSSYADFGFDRFVEYARASAVGAKGGVDLVSAMLRDPIALDGQRRRCAAGEQPVALIDLDPKGSVFAPPANPGAQPGKALGLAMLREAGVEIAWLSDMSVNQSGLLRTALEQSGLDPRGEDIISLRRDGDDSKYKRKENLAGITCIVAIAGDERPDFDERFLYLRTLEAGAGLEPVIGNGWFLIEPVLSTEGQ